MGTVSIRGKLERDLGSIRLYKVIAVEGTDEVYFLDALLRHLKINDAEVTRCLGKRPIQEQVAWRWSECLDFQMWDSLR